MIGTRDTEVKDNQQVLVSRTHSLAGDVDRRTSNRVREMLEIEVWTKGYGKTDEDTQLWEPGGPHKGADFEGRRHRMAKAWRCANGLVIL